MRHVQGSVMLLSLVVGILSGTAGAASSQLDSAAGAAAAAAALASDDGEVSLSPSAVHRLRHPRRPVGQPTSRLTVYEDPCKADYFLGDIALTNKDVVDVARRWRHVTVDGGDAAVGGVQRPSTPTSATDDVTATPRRPSDVIAPSHRLKRLRSRSGAKSNRKYRSPTKKTTAGPPLSAPVVTDGSDSAQSAETSRSTSGSSSSRRRRAATSRTDRLWDYGVIPYDIDTNFSGAHKALFKQAMRHWENHTCISFVERTPEDYNYIVFTERPCGCCSFVGKRGNGPQAISIGKNCDKFGIVVHELGHVIGFWHEHTRPDRGEYVQILYDNIMPGQENNFYTVAPNEVDSLGEPYDFQSIMHYARNTFSKATELDSIVPRPELLPSGGGFVRHDIGQRVKLSDGDVAQANKLYRCPKCGRTLQDSQGVFGSPVTTNGGGGDGGSWPPQTGRSELCQWRIQATHGEKIVLNVTMLDLPDSVDCTNSYLEVRDGPSITSPLIGRFCGSAHLPGTMMSSDSRMWIEYRLSHVGRYRGFAAKYEAVCGGEVQRENGILSSPNYPEYYKPSKECVWKIKVPDGYTAALKFQSFEVENHDTCVYDYVEVRDGSDPGSPLLGKFCGYRIPQDVRSSSNLLYVKFVSDGSVQKEGFAATFVKEHDECQSEDHGCEHICINTVGGYRCECKIGFELNQDGRTCEDACGGYLDGANGTFMSPFFPSVYPPNKNCVWMIVAPPQHRITITFTHFDVEGNNQDCEYDSVEIRSGLDQNSRIHGTYCGSHLPQPVTSESNRLRVSFTTDNTVQKSGFSAYFFTDKDECATNNGGCQHVCKNTIGSYECSCLNGFTLHDNKHDCKEGGCQHEVTTVSGDVTSPNWPENYPSRKECVWHFTTTPGHRIKLVFSEFELEAHLECTYDSVAVYDGEDSSTRLIGRYCGNARPPPAGIISRSNRLYMKFTSDASVQRRGFFASHSTVCGGMLTATDHVGEFYSHAKYGDHNYDNRADCDWMIVAENQHQRVRLRFQTLEIEVENECGYDYVEVYDGSSPEATQLGRFCGNELPPEFLSSGPMLFVRFKTDDTIFGKGFAAIYMQASYDGLIPPTGGSLSGVPSLIPYEPKSRKGKTVPSKKQHQQHLRTVTKTVT